jgi:DNA-binding NarL/FixJ family response regulator
VPLSASAEPSPLRVLIVDDHTILREGLVRILQGGGRHWHVEQAANAHEALEACRRQRLDLAIVDITLPGMSGLDLVRRMRAEFSRLGILVLTMHSEKQYALRAFRNGANGFLTKERAGAELIEAARKVAAGGVYVTASLAEHVVLDLQGHSGRPSHEQLSDRELDVLSRIVDGQRISDIAEELHLSVKTVSTHKRRIMDKLGLSSTAALVRYGMEQDLTGRTQPCDLDGEGGTSGLGDLPA